MPENQKKSADDATPDTATGAAAPQKRKLLSWPVIIVLIVVALGLVFFYAPRYAARYLITSELERLGIDHQGFDTLEINPWTLEAWLGPADLGVGTSNHAQVGKVGLDLRFNPLLDRQVSIERLLLSGIDVVVARSKEDVITLNGIPVDQVIPPAASDEPAAEETDTWGAGLDILELRDSKLIFEDRGRGDVEIDIKRLTMSDFRTWEPNRPGRFELEATVNDIQLNWSGEARPFADKITFAIDSRTEQADVPKVVRFTGPLLGLDRREGTYDAALKYEVSLSESGRVEGHTTGSIDIKDADYQAADVFELAFERAKIDLDVRYIVSESGDVSLQGEVATDLAKSSTKIGDKTSFGAKSGRLAITELELKYAKDGRLTVSAQPDLDLQDVEFSGPVEISVDKLLQLLALLQSLSAGTEVSAADTGLGDFAGGSVAIPSSDVTVARLRSQGESFSLESDGGKFGLDMKTGSDLSKIKIGIDERTISIERLQSELQKFSLKSGKGELALDMAGKNSLTAGTSVSPIGELKVDELEAKTDPLVLRVQTGTVSVQLASSARTKGVLARLNAREQRPTAKFQIGTASASLSQGQVDAQGDTLNWRVAGGAEIDSLSAEFAKGEQGALKFNRAEIKALQADQGLELAADALNVDGLDLYVKRSLLRALLGDGDAGVGEAGPSATASKAATTSSAPASGGKKPDIRRIQSLLSELGYEPGPVDGQMGQRTRNAIKKFQGDDGMAVNGQPTARLLSRLETRATGPSTATVPVASGQTAGPNVRLGQFAMTGKSVIRFRDDVVTPNVKVDTVFKEIQLRNLNTRKSKQRTDVQVSASINEFTQVSLTGWINGISENADFDLNTKVDNLELSNYSPYIEALAGVYLESGQLDTTTAGKTSQGNVQGEIQLGLEKISFRPLSAEDAARMTESMGVPLPTAVSLLQDNDGRITLKLPVTGTLAEPNVDISSAVNKAIGGALKKVFPPTMVASLLSGVSKSGGAAFEPIVFAPGSVELDQAGRDYADGLAKFLGEHPKLSLHVCGRSTLQDSGQSSLADGVSEPSGEKAEAEPEPTEPAPDKAGQVAMSAEAAQRLEELAVERKRTVRRYLVKEKGVDPKRVGECRSSFEADDQGNPRVEISF